jgi:hypothetical protein
MSEREDDIETLHREINSAYGTDPIHWLAAKKVVESDWLAARDARIREEALGPVRALRAEIAMRDAKLLEAAQEMDAAAEELRFQRKRVDTALMERAEFEAERDEAVGDVTHYGVDDLYLLAMSAGLEEFHRLFHKRVAAIVNTEAFDAWERGALQGREYQKRLLVDWSRIGPAPTMPDNPYRAVIDTPAQTGGEGGGVG